MVEKYKKMSPAMFDTIIWHTAEREKGNIFTNLAEAGKTSDRHYYYYCYVCGEVVVMFDKQKPLDLALGDKNREKKQQHLATFQGHSNSSLRVRLFGFTLITTVGPFSFHSFPWESRSSLGQGH